MNTKDHPLANEFPPLGSPPANGIPAPPPEEAKGPVQCEPVQYTGQPSNAQAMSRHLANATVTPFASCKQQLWFSFFFDGTGNNLAADRKTEEHSNVARLYLAHQGNENMGGRIKDVQDAPPGTYRIYIPGVGTYFRAVQDEGGTNFGLGFGKLGDARIEWALKQYDVALAHHVALAKDPKNAILEVNIAAFGFSRGAALARAFIQDFVRTRCKYASANKLKTNLGNCDLRIRFVGIFDTVASAGVAMSGNNMGKIDAAFGDTASHVESRLQHFTHVRPHSLAFAPKGQPGADPAPGKYDGHKAYGGRVNMPAVVEEVRHFVAAHEIRNSFPLDSLSIRSDRGFEKPAHSHEYPFPGVHSDVGGGYRPGESGKSPHNGLKLSQIPLRMMFNFALRSGVPFHPQSAWTDEQKLDFEILDELEERFKYYQKQVVADAGNLGSMFNAHMKMYYRWRFQDINKKNKDDKAFKERVSKYSDVFQKEGAQLDTEIARRKNWTRKRITP